MTDVKARVVEVRSENILEDNSISRAEAYRMFAAGFGALGSPQSGSDILKELFPARARIGIKVNSLAGPRMSTSPQLVYALADFLSDNGHSKNDIIIWDRRERELKKAGYKLSSGGSDYLCIATDTKGAGFSPDLYSHNSIGSMVSRIQAEMIDFGINFPVLKDHSLAGLSGCLKNYYGAIHNPNKYHENMCDPFQSDLYSLDIIGAKERLAVFDAVRVQYNGGPGYVDYWATDYKAIIISRDAIALDTVGVEIIDRLRTKYDLPRLKDCEREPAGIKSAGKAGLGIAELDKIEWLVIEV